MQIVFLALLTLQTSALRINKPVEFNKGNEQQDFDDTGTEEFFSELGLAFDQFERESDALLTDMIEGGFNETCKAEIQKGNRKNKQCIDPWFEKKDCTKSFEIPFYRLGDEVNQFLSLENTAYRMQFYFPGSIGDLYWKGHKKRRDIQALENIIDSPEFAKWEKPSDDTLVAHIRAYDMSGSEYDRTFRKQGKSYYEKAALTAVQSGLKNVVLVTGDHWIGQKSNLNEGNEGLKQQLAKATKQTDDKLRWISEIFENHGLQVSVRKNFNADCDFVYMSNAKTFLHSAGTFDKLIEDIVKRKGAKLAP